MAIQDLTGKTFGRLKVVGVEKGFNGKTTWVCVCRCGERRLCAGWYLRKGRAKACHTCALRLMRQSARKRMTNRPSVNRDPDKLAAMLDDEGRRRYERWQSSCERLDIRVTKDERIGVLRELVDRKAA